MAHIRGRLQAYFREIAAPGRFNGRLGLGNIQIQSLDLGVGFQSFLPKQGDLGHGAKFLGQLPLDVHLNLLVQSQGASQDLPG